MAFFILANAFLVLGAGLLSAFHAFSTLGYSLLLAVGGVLWASWLLHARPFKRWNSRRIRALFRRRLSRSLPPLFLAIALLSFIGGAAYPPSQYDALTYRIPRLLHWWSDGQIQTIASVSLRMNYSQAGHELALAPLLIATRSVRWLFLVNLAAFLLLPGAFFSVLRMLGVRGRAAWNWMWLLPTGYCYVMQAGGVGNDAYGAVLTLVSLRFALRARITRRFADAALGVLGAALLTGVKASNIPLLLPLGLALLPGIGAMLRYRLRSAGVMACAALVSCLPVLVANHIRTGDWTGDPENHHQLRVTDHIAAFTGNGLEIAAKCLEPSLLPGAELLTKRMTAWIPEWVQSRLSHGFPRFSLGLSELAQEENSGLGLGVTLLLAICAVRSRGRANWSVAGWLSVASAIALLGYMVMLGSESAGRLLAPYYPLLAIAAIRGLDSTTVRTRCWQCAATACALSGLLPLLITPSRPILPRDFILQAARALHVPAASIDRAELVYRTYHSRSDMLGSLRDSIPSSVKRIGVVITEDDSELSLWMPFGRRVVVDPGQECGPVGIRRELAQWWVFDEAGWKDRGWGRVEDWLARNDVRVRFEANLITVIREGARRWIVVELPELPAPTHSQ